ncbi:hypothetical protein ASF12_22835 [Paenibacillus sp. Leaf72]|nr:hypothetical protein ASF12_22835 [Paenibacillus sp. Leaf72]
MLVLSEPGSTNWVVQYQGLRFDVTERLDSKLLIRSSGPFVPFNLNCVKEKDGRWQKWISLSEADFILEYNHTKSIIRIIHAPDQTCYCSLWPKVNEFDSGQKYEALNSFLADFIIYRIMGYAEELHHKCTVFNCLKCSRKWVLCKPRFPSLGFWQEYRADLFLQEIFQC